MLADTAHCANAVDSAGRLPRNYDRLVHLDWTADETAFRNALRASIEANIRPGWTLDDRDMPEPDDVEAVKSFCAALGSDGFLTPHWPAEHGGRQASPWEQLIISEETWRVGEPRGGQYMNTNWIGPALMAYGTPEQQAQHLPPISRGEVNWCQGFSEPDAGSDLAALRSRAVRDGDSYIVNGQKIWTSYAHAAEWCFLLVRTDPESPKREGITILLVPMDTAGIEVREIPNPYARHLIHEIHFTDVVVPVANRLGDENQGWGIVRNVLANERVGIARHAHSEHVLDTTVADARALGVDVDDAGSRRDHRARLRLVRSGPVVELRRRQRTDQRSTRLASARCGLPLDHRPDGA